ncbi:MAG: YihY/virulence factor BrkB family protein [Elusimicrobia bacterium]|jgi:membrane protein|nr:YihY/virulence factor BrkB family protein [Elusimicrobiota bacterium]
MTAPVAPPGRWVLRLVGLTLKHWREDNCPLIAAGLAYYTIISLVPLFLIALALGGVLLGPIASVNQLAPALEGLLGAQIARPIEKMVLDAAQREWGGATLASVAILFWVASIVFNHLQRALNLVWECPGRRGVGGELLNRLVAFGMVMGTGLFVLVFAVMMAGLGLLRNVLDPWVPLLESFPFWWAMNLAIFFLLMMLFWGMVYRFLPTLKLRWRDVGVGALVTTALMTGGIYVLGYYFSRVKFWSIFGAAASVMVVLIWIYFTNQIFLLGAEFTWAWAHRHVLLNNAGVSTPPPPASLRP